MAKKTVCCWCDSPVRVKDDFDEWHDVAVCSQACKAGEMTFRQWMSDEEINRRQHYKQLTRGE